MNIIEKVKPWLGRKSVRGALLIIVLILVAISIGGDDAKETELSTKLPVVEITSSNDYLGNQTLSVIGTVRAFSEAVVTSEVSGRVTSVPVTLGQEVQAGTILATLENASQRAAVLQAEGVYEAALAAAAQSTVGVSQAQTSLENAKESALNNAKSTFNSANSILKVSVDAFYNQPQSPSPRLLIAGQGYTQTLNRDRVEIGTDFDLWQSQIQSATTDSDLQTLLSTSRSNTNSLLSLVDTFLLIFSNQDDQTKYQSELSEFTALRSQIIGLLSSVDSSQSQLKSAEDSLEQAKLASTGGTTSASDAQVKQALGTLRSAQANLAKTILRTPVSGTVNSLSVRNGDFINGFSEVAVVANNNALEIITFVSDTEKERLSVGDTLVIEKLYEGVITQIAPAVDQATKKTEVRIALEEANIANGDTVRIEKEFSPETNTTEIMVPITAIKFERENGFLFKVEDGQLVTIPVEVGDVLGGSVIIKSGIDHSTTFVVDARGLVDGDKVEVTE